MKMLQFTITLTAIPISNKVHIGVLISKDLSWSLQFDKVISDCRKQTLWILRIFTNRDTPTMSILWISLLHPIIAFCPPLYLPRTVNYCTTLLTSLKASFAASQYMSIICATFLMVISKRPHYIF